MRTLLTTPKGFTLAEILVALSVLGIIAVFTIPKVLTTTQNNDYKYRVQTAAALMSSAYARYRTDNTVTTSMRPQDLTPYLNYVSYHDSGLGLSVDGKQNTAQTWPCDNSNPCVKLANGAVIVLYGGAFSGLSPSNAVIFIVDPDGQVTDGTTNGPGRAVEMYMYATNGRIADVATIDNPTRTNGLDRAPNPTQLPSWFSWN